MNASRSGKLAHCVRKRELSPLRRACLSLGLEVDARPKTNLAWLLRKAGLGRTAIDYLKFSKDEQARRIVELHCSLNATERGAVTIDYLIMAAGADPPHIWGCLNEELYRVRGMEAELLVCLALPDAMRVTVREAKKPKGHSAREHLFKAAGILPVPGQQSAFATLFSARPANRDSAVRVSKPLSDAVPRAIFAETALAKTVLSLRW